MEDKKTWGKVSEGPSRVQREAYYVLLKEQSPVPSKRREVTKSKKRMGLPTKPQKGRKSSGDPPENVRSLSAEGQVPRGDLFKKAGIYIRKSQRRCVTQARCSETQWVLNLLQNVRDTSYTQEKHTEDVVEANCKERAGKRSKKTSLPSTRWR